MVNIILITNGSRPHLLEQTLRTLYENTPEDEFTITAIFDGCDPQDFEGEFSTDNASLVGISPACHIIGRLKNLGCYWSEKQFGRGEWLCFLDDDIAFFPDWLEKMIESMNIFNDLRLLGGVRHPFHGIKHNNQMNRTWDETDAVAGYCHFMRWSTWDKFGPYDAHAKGTGQSEDFAVCRKIVEAGGKVGYIHPPVMAHCGLTNSECKPILGGDQIERVEGILYE